MKVKERYINIFQRVSLLKAIVGLVAVLVVSAAGLFLYNPPEKARLSRDQQRIQDLQDLTKAIDRYIKNNQKEKIEMCDRCGLEKTVFSSGEISFEGSFIVKSSVSSVVNITGWIPIDFSLNARLGETPTMKLPLDPVNVEPYVFTYSPGKNAAYKLSAALESIENDNLEAEDGGKDENRYEVGTNLNLPPY